MRFLFAALALVALLSGVSAQETVNINFANLFEGLQLPASAPAGSDSTGSTCGTSTTTPCVCDGGHFAPSQCNTLGNVATGFQNATSALENFYDENGNLIPYNALPAAVFTQINDPNNFGWSIHGPSAYGWVRSGTTFESFWTTLVDFYSVFNIQAVGEGAPLMARHLFDSYGFAVAIQLFAYSVGPGEGLQTFAWDTVNLTGNNFLWNGYNFWAGPEFTNVLLGTSATTPAP